MSGTSVGFFGKLPSHGDFIERRVSSAFRDVWDPWLQRCIAESKQTLGSTWLDCYLTSPIWRFFLCDGVAGAASYAGVLLPSVDRVGRYFPLTVVLELPTNVAPLAFARTAGRWFAEVERLCTDALQEEGDGLVVLDAALIASAEMLVSIDQLPQPRPFPGASLQWRWPLRSIEALDPALGEPLSLAAESALRPMTMWWTEGSERVGPSVLLARSLPRPETFRALLDGSWLESGWDGDAADAPVEETLSAQTQYGVASAGVTDVGTVREQNQDNLLLNDGNRLWSVADGMGGHQHGEIASQMVVDALNAVEPTPTLNSALESVAVALSRVNADLRRAALGVERSDGAGSTVVTLAIRGDEWGVSWAGDSRAYLLRAGTLTQLTRDHKPAVPEEWHETEALDVLVASTSSEITRAVGGEDSLQLDSVTGVLADGDRFLLCSDGLYGALSLEAIVEHLGEAQPQDACRTLIDAARTVGARDNVTALVVDVHSSEPAPGALS
jgi:type VI secretion system protein ImpM